MATTEEHITCFAQQMDAMRTDVAELFTVESVETFCAVGSRALAQVQEYNHVLNAFMLVR